MTVGEMERLLATIKDKSMTMVMDFGEGVLEDICGADSGIIELKDDDGEIEVMLNLAPCYCDEEDFISGEINSRPELN